MPDVHYSNGKNNTVANDQRRPNFFRDNKLITNSKHKYYADVDHPPNTAFVEFFFAFKR